MSTRNVLLDVNVNFMGITLQELIDKAKETHGNGVDLSKVTLEISGPQRDNFGQDRHDGIRVTSRFNPPMNQERTGCIGNGYAPGPDRYGT